MGLGFEGWVRSHIDGFNSYDYVPACVAATVTQVVIGIYFLVSTWYARKFLFHDKDVNRIWKVFLSGVLWCVKGTAISLFNTQIAATLFESSDNQVVKFRVSIQSI